jgi:hypothetical protein
MPGGDRAWVGCAVPVTGTVDPGGPVTGTAITTTGRTGIGDQARIGDLAVPATGRYRGQSADSSLRNIPQTVFDMKG